MADRLKPLIAVPSDCLGFDGYVWNGAPVQYLEAASKVADVAPLIVPSLGRDADIQSILAVVDGVLITGAKSNVNPARYGEAATTDHEPFDFSRDETSFSLIHAAIRLGLPLLAICRGIQELNVALGGTLSPALQKIPGKLDHRANDKSDSDKKFAIRQPVHVSENTSLSKIVGTGEIMVNSVHQQGINKLAPRLVAEATAPDGTIEAVSVKDAKDFSLGVQWHPEYWATSDIPSNKIFKAFGEAVHHHNDKRLEKTGAVKNNHLEKGKP
ncbi:gamma-glutamyl-gamma-aminobutyrate hydrolase family protein [Bartonella sp. W8098]|uniref:gamma-glutamyl-gamma-aminobutyrate hydrolase family protein n=1 Tax=Bartonella TaxID=773 RepID=UPI0018DE381F|nr:MULTISPECIES: gamma-glutamyl-gamma-aminobutyrate hydrolase family protein [Bartonella]MBH9988666.1 gamma-glutamyl-gamma-aminobutyrate hydrolase family protein [Bartonella apis]MBI0172714.1 gamma-glutamyl-gamma-aminobutyrate hydrolase family protein [Bartonella sp. W8151]